MLILKIWYLSDYNSKSLDFDFIGFLFSSAFRIANSSNSDFIWPSKLKFDQGLFIFHQKSNVDFRGQLLFIKKSEFDNLGLVRFLWFLAFHWHRNCKTWISFGHSIWRFPLRCQFRGFSNNWLSIIHNKSISYPKITKYISINSIFSLVSKYITFVIFWLCLILWFCRVPTIRQSQCFDFDCWLFSIKSEISTLKTSYLSYLYHFHISHLIFSYLKLLLNLSLTKSTLRLKSTLLSVDRSDTYPILDYYILSLWVRFYNFFLTIVFVF